MTEYTVISGGSRIGNCPSCGYVVGDNVETEQCRTGFDCGRCGQYTSNEPIDLSVEISIPRESLADPSAGRPEGGETAI